MSPRAALSELSHGMPLLCPVLLRRSLSEYISLGERPRPLLCEMSPRALPLVSPRSNSEDASPSLLPTTDSLTLYNKLVFPVNQSEPALLDVCYYNILTIPVIILTQISYTSTASQWVASGICQSPALTDRSKSVH